MRFYTTQKLGDKRHLTPEGFLVCEEVAIARTGVQTYGPYETPIDPGPDGVVYIQREADEVFRPETIASFNGKPVVDEHPDDDVQPKNWRALAMGTMLDVRRGKGVQDDLLLADLVIYDQATIQAIIDGKRELSCGYDADYDETEPGRGRQYNIVGNHLALVAQGRCGSRCAIGDHRTADCAYKGERSMKWKDLKKLVIDTLTGKDDAESKKALAAVKDAKFSDDAEMGEPGSGGGVHLHMNSGGEEGRTKYTDAKLDEMFAANEERHKGHDTALQQHVEKYHQADDSAEREIEGRLEEEAPPGTGDKARRAKDSVYLQDSFRSTVSMAEIIVPGVRLPTFDQAAKPKETYLAICGLRRRTLQLATRDVATLQMLEDLRGGRSVSDDEITRMDCGKVKDLFFALGAAKRQANNGAHRGTGRPGDDAIPGNGGGTGVKGKIQNSADLNTRHADFYKTT